MNLKTLKKYFTYSDKLRTVVSIITGILIAFFNAASSFVIILVFYEEFFEIDYLDFWTLLLYIIPTIILGAGILKFCIFVIEMALRSIEIEDYSYLRLVLLISILFYILILVFYFSFEMSGIIENTIPEMLKTLTN